MQPNKYIQMLKPYIPIAHKIWEIPNKDEIIKLDWNESTMPPSPQVYLALQQALQYDKLHWYPNTKNTQLLELLSTYTNLPSSCIEIFASSDCIHEFILQVFGKTSNTVCIIAPTYDNFRSNAEGRGLCSLFFYTDEWGRLDWEKLDTFLATKKPNMLYLCNPNNPTGTLHDIDKLQELIIKYKDILFIIDEAYYEFCGQSIAHRAQDTQNLIITRTFSKAFGLASFRIGYCLSTPQNIATLNRLRNPKNIAHFSQVAAIAALQDSAYMREYVKKVKEAREFFIAQIDSMNLYKIYPTQANFVFLQYDKAAKLCAFLESQNIFIRNYAHIMPNHCRISIGTKEQMQKVIESMQTFTKENRREERGGE